MNKEFRTPFYGTVPTSSLPASNITYDNSSSGIDATNVQDAIDAVAQGGGGGGESNVFVINCTKEDEAETMTTDKSYSEAVAAVLAGKSLAFNIKYENEGVVGLIQSANTWLAQGDFSNPTPETLYLAIIITEDYWVYTDEYTMGIM